jgi:hypothetical protein
MLEKELDYETMTPDILADFIFKVSGYKVNHANIKARIEHMINKECSKRSHISDLEARNAEMGKELEKMTKFAHSYKHRNYQKIIWKDKARRIIAKLWKLRKQTKPTEGK